MIRKIGLAGCLFLCISIHKLQAQELLSLDGAIRQSLQNSYDIQVSKNDAEIAAVSNSWALAGRLPTVNANLGFTYSLTNLRQELSNGTITKRDGAQNRNLNSNVTGDWIIFNGFRVTSTKRRLEEEQRVGEYNLRQQTNQTVFDVTNNYYNVARLQQQLSALKETISLFEERVKLAKARFEIGTAAKNDYLQSQVDLNDQRNTMLILDNDLKVAKTTLNNLLSRNPATAFTVTDSAIAVTLPAKNEVLNQLDSLNPQLLSARSTELALMQQHRVIQSQLYPVIGIGAGANFTRSNNSAGFTLLNQNLGPQAGVTVSIPLFQGGIVKRQLKINEIQQKTQQTVTRNIRNDLQTQLENAYNEYDNANQQYALQQQSLALVQENSMIAMERFRRAAITLVDLRQVQLSLVTTQTNLINARYTMKLNEVTLQFVTGSILR